MVRWVMWVLLMPLNDCRNSKNKGARTSAVSTPSSSSGGSADDKINKVMAVMNTLAHLIEDGGVDEVSALCKEHGVKPWFWQFELDEASKPLTCFVTPSSGAFCYNRLPMGLKCSPAIVQSYTFLT